MNQAFWDIIRYNWTLDERALLCAHVDAWMAAEVQR